MIKGKQLILAAAVLLLSATGARAGEKAKLGPCVRQCVQAYNPALADSGADEFMADDFRARECVRLCKENLYQGECNGWEDGCCHPDFIDSDPDCQSEPPSEPPEPPDQPGTGNLPPDPGDAGKATLTGIDADGDGLRDDIQRYIALTYPDSARTRAALRQYARALQKAILESPDEQSALQNTEVMHRAIDCLWYIYSEKAIDLSDRLVAAFLNTPARTRAYLDYNDFLGGHVFGGSEFEDDKRACVFDLDAMED